MTADIVRFLEEEGGYRPISRDLHLGGVDFGFDGVMVGPGGNDDLVLIVDLSQRNLARVNRQAQAFSTLLRRSGSSRAITLVLVSSDDLPEKDLERIQTACRTLVISPARARTRTLGQLLPLQFPDTIQVSGAGENRFLESLGPLAKEGLTRRLVRSAKKGPTEVKELVRSELQSICQRALTEAE